jgi:hypothetical protein
MQLAQWAEVEYPTFATWIQERRREETKAANRGGTSEAVTWVLVNPRQRFSLHNE